MDRKIKVLIVDDSVIFRSLIQSAISTDPKIEVVGVAANGKIALDKMMILHPDICILDMEMPEMDGHETLRQMRSLNISTKALMFSSQSKAGAEKTLEAMRLGAIDFVAKPLAGDAGGTAVEKIREALVTKITSLFSVEKPKVTAAPKASSSGFQWGSFNPEILVIASSTGGPNALAEFFSLLKEPFPFPILITQHMPPLFTASLAERLGKLTGKIAKEGEHGEIIKPNQIYVAPGNFHMSLAGTKIETRIVLDQAPARNYVRPCADFLFESASKIYGSKTLGMVFTGMGRDGADGAVSIKGAGGAVMIQDQASCVVFGMPGAVHESGKYDFSGAPHELADKLLQIVRARRSNVA